MRARIIAFALVMLSATLATVPTPSDAAATCSSDQPFSRMRGDALLAAVQCAQDLNNAGHTGTGQIAGPALLALEKMAGLYGGCFEPYPGNGDEKIQWTPRFAVNSPYSGESKLTQSASSTASFKFGTHGADMGGGLTQTQTYAIGSEDGHARAVYVLLEWTHVHGRYWCSVPPVVQDFWFISNREPTGTYYQREGELTGASNLTDADNLLVPVGGEFAQ